MTISTSFTGVLTEICFINCCMTVMEGPLSKWTNVVKGWQYRWFVLDEISGLLSYYTVSCKSRINILLNPAIELVQNSPFLIVF